MSPVQRRAGSVTSSVVVGAALVVGGGSIRVVREGTSKSSRAELVERRFSGDRALTLACRRLARQWGFLVEGQQILGWRDVPVDEEHVGTTANATRPHVRQLFIGAGPGWEDDQQQWNRKEIAQPEDLWCGISRA